MNIKNILLIQFGLFFLLSFSSVGVDTPDSPSTNDLGAIKERLSSDFHQALLKETYTSLISRIEPDGYFHESLTGVYPGMFPRGGWSRLLLELEEYQTLEKFLGYCIQSVVDNEMNRMPHVIGRREKITTPLPDPQTLASLDASIPYAKLNECLNASQTFTAGSEQLTAVEVLGTIYAYKTNPRCLDVEITDANGTSIAKSSLSISKDVIHRWVRIEFAEPVKLAPGQVYKICFSCPAAKGPLILFAGKKARNSGFGVAYRNEGQTQVPHPDLTLSVVFDEGNLKHSFSDEKIPVISNGDEVDGEAHILMGWGMLAQQRGPTKFEDDTYEIVAKLMDRSTDSPYLAFHPGNRTQPGVVCNIMFEHSRGWCHVYDFLTQAFVSSALENLIPIARRRGDTKRVNVWSGRLKQLNANIHENMVRDFEGKKIFLEMLLPTGATPKPFPGLSWINLAPIPSGWKGVDPVIFKNTIEAWHTVAQIKWDGPAATSCHWRPEGQEEFSEFRLTSNSVIGKQLGWDMVYCLNAKEYDRVCQMLDFLEKVNSTKIVAEAFYYNPNSKKWTLADPGNGEQATWYSWSMVVLRKAVGLPPLPVGTPYKN